MSNFLLASFEEASRVNQALLSHGVIVRPLAAYGLGNYVRIGVGAPDEKDQLLKALFKVIATGRLRNG